MEFLAHSVLHTLEHTLYSIPFLFLAYLFMIYLERNSAKRLSDSLNNSTGFAPIVGGLVGCIPQCGFSVAAADMYNRSKITSGTLIAVFIATSDEAIPILLASGGNFQLIGALIGTKLVLGIAVGLIVDRFLPKKLFEQPKLELAQHKSTCECCHRNPNIFLAALKHTAIVFALIFGVSLLFEMALELVGTDLIEKLMLNGSVLQPMIAAAIGLIPNCAASIVIAQLFLEGAISFGSAIAGLTTGAGFGLIVLLRGSTDRKAVLRILALLYIVASLTGMLLQIIL